MKVRHIFIVARNMSKYLILFIAVASEWHYSNALRRSHDVDTHIIGGKDAKQSDFPYHVELRLRSQGKDSNFCGGGIIQPRWVLTAAHCTIAALKYNLAVIIVAGTDSATSGGTSYKADKLITHEDYSDYTTDNDIALIRSATEILFNNLVKAISLPDQDTPANTTCVVAGFGYTQYNNGKKLPSTRQMIELRTISTEECKDAFRTNRNTISERQICTYVGRNKGTCKGDSGSPLVADDKVIGVVSWGVACARGSPDVFARVYPYLDWIDNNIKKNS